MKILKLLNKNCLPIILIIFLFAFDLKAEDEPIDIWNIDKSKIEETQSNISQNNLINSSLETSETSIYDLQSEKNEIVKISSSLNSKKLRLWVFMILKIMILKLTYGLILMVIN